MDLLHVCLNVADADRAEDWYVDQLGFERTREFTTADGTTRNVYLAADNGAEIQLSETEGETDLEAGTLYDHVAISVGSVDDTIEAMDHYGIVREPVDLPEAGARIAFVKDPDGHHVELIEPL